MFDKFNESPTQLTKFNFDCSDKEFESLKILLDIYNRGFIQCSQCDFSSLMVVIRFFHCSSLSIFLQNYVPSTISETIDILSQESCFNLQKIFNKCLTILTENFFDLHENDISKLSNSALFYLFISPNFQINNENELFIYIQYLIKQNPSRKILLKTIHYPFVSSDYLDTFFNELSFEDLDEDLFECFKERLVCDITKPVTFPSTDRWKSKYRFISLDEINSIFDLLRIQFGKIGQPVEQIQSLIHDNAKYIKKISELNQKNESIHTQIHELQDQILQFQNLNNGFKTELEASKQDNQIFTNRIQQLKKSKSEKKGIIQKLNEKNQQLESDMQMIKLENQTLLEQNQNQKLTIQKLKAEIHNMIEIPSDNPDKKLQTIKINNERLIKEKMEFKKVNVTLKNQIKDIERNILTMKSFNFKLTKETQELKKKIEKSKEVTINPTEFQLVKANNVRLYNENLELKKTVQRLQLETIDIPDTNEIKLFNAKLKEESIILKKRK